MPVAKRVSIITLGCLKNTSDTSNLARLLRARGHEVVPDAAQADAIVVHTCSFIEAAKKESINTILEAGQVKKKGKQLIVTGCLVQQHGQEIFDEMPEVDAFLGTGQLAQVADVLEKPRKRFLDRANPGGFMDPDISPHPTPSPRGEGWGEGATATLRLSEGCSHPCTFCVIPRLRGPVQSRSEETILKEARELAAQGVEEFSIIAQDTGDWGKDVIAKSGATKQSVLTDRHASLAMTSQLPRLLRKIAAIDGLRWIRLMYMHPASFTEELMDVLAGNPDKFPYLDMPFQHIDSEVLSQMQRKSDEKGLRKLLKNVKAAAPQLSLRTTFIVGFPGETEAQFDRLLGFVKEGHFDYLGAFAYSKEEGTPAARREDQIPDDVKEDRLTQLTNAYYDVAHTKAQGRLGTTETVILEETEEDTIVGRTRREAPEIDAIVRLPQEAARHGRFIKARLIGYDAYEFSAVPVGK